MKILKKSAATALLVGASVSAPAFAQDAGFYLGAGLGISKFQQGCDGSPVSCDDKDRSWKLLGGYQFNKNFGVEAGYADLGKVTGAGIFSGIAVSAEAKAKAFEVVAVGTIPLAQNFSAYAKAGLARWDLDVSARAGAAVAGASDKGNDFTFGIGVKYDFSKNVAARLEWQRYNDVGSSSTGQSDIDVLGIGIIFKF